MPNWIYDEDGLIRAADQHCLTHPSQLSICNADEVGVHRRVNHGNASHRNASYRELENHALIRLARGIYLECVTWNKSKPYDRYSAMVKALVPRHSNVVVTGEAAAALHGLPLLIRKTTIALAGGSRRPRSPRRSSTSGSVFRPNALVRRVGNHIAAEDVVEIGGRRVTDIPKTVIDICRTQGSENGLVVADAALREWCTREELLSVLREYPNSPGNRRAREILSIAGDRSESVGETLTKRCIVDSGIAGFPEMNSGTNQRLMQQVEFYDNNGFVARVDFYLPHLNTVIEFDGATKYSTGAVKVTEEILIQEQAREKRLKNMGLDVLRLRWLDVLDGACVDPLRQFAARQRRRMAEGGLVFSRDMGWHRDTDLPFKTRQLRNERIQNRALYRKGIRSGDSADD